MKKFITLLFLILTLTNICYATSDLKIEGGITVNEIPRALFGNWRVNAKLEDCNSYGTFKPNSIDFWSLTRVGNTITLSNPFTGAKAAISVKTVEDDIVVFSKKAPYDNKILTDTITIRLNKESFTGYNTLLLETHSNIDNKIIKTESAKYQINGEKISGDSIIEK